MVEFLSEEDKKEYSAAFKLFDDDGDGCITEKEIGKVMKQLGQNPTNEELYLMIKEVDEDGNGTIEEEEFLAMIGNKKKTQGQKGHTAEFLRTYGKLQPGVISIPELRRIMLGVGEKLSDDELENLLRVYGGGPEGLAFDKFKDIMGGGPAPTASPAAINGYNSTV
eukprot:CAMPEP_0185027994 /NCGR_PEP_ID=MMETSP1103-20130426/13399_1 /TAXON_ID=36769 /ORGANISM="Paraphysomonas bandaiensis, Strain Caron Lab Isolate" /LENGTH=165 /DNA_ID=CAMNT_0027562219 /DNA_START=115 /DNA_END=612 /DNA_ORIENTATION=-